CWRPTAPTGGSTKPSSQATPSDAPRRDHRGRGGAARGRAVPTVGGTAGGAGGRERVGQPHVPPRGRAPRAAADGRGVRGGRREGAHLAAAPGAAPAAARP